MHPVTGFFRNGKDRGFSAREMRKRRMAASRAHHFRFSCSAYEVLDYERVDIFRP